MKRFLALALVVFGLAACQNDPEVINPVGGEVDYELTVAAPELGTTRAVTGMDSAQGAIDNFDDALIWDTADLRYILEIYNADEDGEGTDITLVKERMVQVVDKYEPVVFKFRIIPGRTYKFVVFADLVAEGDKQAQYNPAGGVVAEGLRHVIGSTLADITVKEDDINDEYGDAYFISKNIEINNALQQSLELTRPYAKLRVITTDMDELNLDVQPGYVVVTYDVDQPTSFNAINGKISTTPGTKSFDFTYEMDGDNKVIRPYTAGKDAVNSSIQNLEAKLSNMTLFTDYVLAVDEEKPTKFRMDVYEDVAMNSPIKSNYFSTDIPLRRNYLTTIIGNVLTTASEVEITIDNKFVNEGVEDDNHYIEVWDGKYKKPAQNAAGEYEIYEASELAWLAASVNGTLPSTFNTKPADNFKGKTFKLMDNINLNNDRWIPIGYNGKSFEGIFDGNGKVIENLTVGTTGEEPIGLFGQIYGSAVVKNVTVRNASINGYKRVAVIVGANICADIENCHVDGAKVVASTLNKDAGQHVGAITGFLSADGGAASVKECTVKNVEVTAFRDVAAVVGTANGGNNPLIEKCSAEYAKVTADQTPEYGSEADGNAGIILGRKASNAVVTECIEGEGNEVIRKVDSSKELEYAIADAKEGDVIYLCGSVQMPANAKNKNLIFNGENGGIINVRKSDGNLNGSNVTFNKVTFVTINSGEGYFNGFVHHGNFVYNECTFTTTYAAINSNHTFNKCVFNIEGDKYNVWNYNAGGKSLFEECTFNCDGKAMLLYGYTPIELTMNNCAFNDNGNISGKAAIEIGDDYGSTYKLVVNNATVNGFDVNPKGTITDSTLWGNKNNMTPEKLTVIIDGSTWVGGSTFVDGNGNYTVSNVDGLKAAFTAKYANIILKPGVYDLNDKVYQLGATTIKAADPANKPVIKGKLVASGALVAENIRFEGNAITPMDAYSNLGRYEKAGYAAIIHLKNVAGTFEGCEFDYEGAAINYFLDANSSLLKVNDCVFTNDAFIYTKALCEITNSSFDTSVPVNAWPRDTKGHPAWTSKITFTGNNCSYNGVVAAVVLLSQSCPWRNIEFNVQNNNGTFTNYYRAVNSVINNTATGVANDGSVTFATGSKKFKINDNGTFGGDIVE